MGCWPTPTAPVVTVFAGPYGAGKSTYFQKFKQQGIAFGEYINTDAIWNSEGRLDIGRARQIAEARKIGCIKKQHSFCFETLLQDSKRMGTLLDAKRNGFQIRLFFISMTDPEECVLRVNKRAAASGYHVSAADIRGGYVESMARLSQAFALADFARIIDSSNPIGQRETFRIIVRKTPRAIRRLEARLCPLWVLRHLILTK